MYEETGIQLPSSTPLQVFSLYESVFPVLLEEGEPSRHHIVIYLKATLKDEDYQRYYAIENVTKMNDNSNSSSNSTSTSTSSNSNSSSSSNGNSSTVMQHRLRLNEDEVAAAAWTSKEVIQAALDTQPTSLSFEAIGYDKNANNNSDKNDIKASIHR